MRSPIIVLALLGGLAAAPAAYAASLQCTSADKSTWLKPAAVTKMLEQHGFSNIGAVKHGDGNCYVVQATDNTGAKKTLYLNPADGSLMALE